MDATLSRLLLIGGVLITYGQEIVKNQKSLFIVGYVEVPMHIIAKIF